MGTDRFSEKDLISFLRNTFSSESPDIALGIGDDAAVVKIGRSRVLLTKDLLLEDQHFRNEFHPPDLLGRKSLNVNLSDIAAMGGKPRFALLGFGLPPETDRQWFVEFIEGLKAAARDADIRVVGGDISKAGKIVVSITVLGLTQTIVARNGAKPGDRIYISGSLGNAAFGFDLIKRGIRLGDNTEMDPFLRSFLDPVPHLALSQELARSHVPSSMIDISDGLSIDLDHICQESGCGADVYLEKIPISPVIKKQSNRSLEFAVHGGEDYELLFTVPPERSRSLSRIMKIFEINEIGIIQEKNGIFLVGNSGKRQKLKIKGFQHF